MKKLLAIGFVCVLGFAKAQTWKTEDQYIQKFAPYAVEEMEKYKIPASITLAQGLLETGGGQSRLAQLGKNHFGIKCKEEWTGKTMKHTDDSPNECFRVYEDPKQSYEDHSIFLATRKYYTKLFDLNPKDYKAWAHGLKKAGYATNPRYAYILIDKIEIQILPIIPHNMLLLAKRNRLIEHRPLTKDIQHPVELQLRKHNLVMLLQLHFQVTKQLLLITNRHIIVRHQLKLRHQVIF